MKCSKTWNNAKQLPGLLSASSSECIVRLRDLLQGSLGYKKENFREILRGNDIMNYTIMALDNFSCCCYWGSEFSVWWRGRCGDSPDDDVVCPWGILIIKVSSVFCWESNLLNISLPPIPFPIHLFLGETGVCQILRHQGNFWDAVSHCSLHLAKKRHSVSRTFGTAAPRLLAGHCPQERVTL